MGSTYFVNENVNANLQSDLPSGSVMPSHYVHYTRDYPPGFNPNVPVRGRMDPGKGLGKGGDFYWRRPVGAVRSKLESDDDGVRIKKDHNVVKGDRTKVLELLELFRERCDKIARNVKDVKRVDFKARHELMHEGIICKVPPTMIGCVPGVEVGDRFYYRVEMMIVGLHNQVERGIDHKVEGGKVVATCVVATEGHSDGMKDPEMLTYVGEGGSNRVGETRDQQLAGGNLALWNSMKAKSPVRVVRGFKADVHNRVRACLVKRTEYVYDGLYEVKSCEKKKALSGSLIFEFKLLRCPGQRPLPRKFYNRNRI